MKTILIALIALFSVNTALSQTKSKTKTKDEFISIIPTPTYGDIADANLAFMIDCYDVLNNLQHKRKEMYKRKNDKQYIDFLKNYGQGYTWEDYYKYLTNRINEVEDNYYWQRNRNLKRFSWAEKFPSNIRNHFQIDNLE